MSIADQNRIKALEAEMERLINKVDLLLERVRQLEGRKK